MLIHHEEKTVSATDIGWSSGTWTGNTSHRLHGMLEQIFIESDSANTTFKFTLTDNQNRIIFNSNDAYLNIMNLTNLRIPLKGVYTMKIVDSSAEEQFKILLGIEELQ